MTEQWIVLLSSNSYSKSISVSCSLPVKQTWLEEEEKKLFEMLFMLKNMKFYNIYMFSTAFIFRNPPSTSIISQMQHLDVKVNALSEIRKKHESVWGSKI